MRKQFSLVENIAIINFSGNYCDTSEKLLNSQGFYSVLDKYVSIIKGKHSTIYTYLKLASAERNPADDVLSLLKLLSVMTIEEIKALDEHYQGYFANKKLLTEFVEEFYNYWRRLERYTLVYNKYYGEGIQKTKFIEANNNFSSLVLRTYRTINEKLYGYNYRVYRQLPAGSNAGIVLNRIIWPIPAVYEGVTGVPFIESVILQPPFITYPKKTTRNGFFEEVFENPLKGVTLDRDKYFCYPAKVGKSLAYIYFNKDFMSQGIALCNLGTIKKIIDQFLGKGY